MENIFVLLIIVAGIIYNVYSNYKKEMEKSAKRVNKPAKQVAPVPPVPSPLAREPIRRDPTPLIPTEVSSVQRYKEQKKKSFPVVKPLPVTQEETIEFNVREAIIYATILERPYKF